MSSPVIFRRILYSAIALILVFAALLAIIIIPPTTIPDQAIKPIVINILIHLLFITTLLWIIKLEKQKGDFRKELLILTGAFLMFFGLIISDGAIAYINDPLRPGMSLVLFICVGLDVLSGLLALSAYFYLRPNYRRKSM